MTHTPDTLFAFLAELGIATRTTDHAPVFTVEESRSLRGGIPGAHTKNLFLRDGKRNHFLVCAEEGAAVDLKRLRARVGARGGLSFASAEALREHLGVTPGAVSLLAAINDRSGTVKVFVDEDLLAADQVNCHPLTNARTTSIAVADLVLFLRATGHEPTPISLGPGNGDDGRTASDAAS